jgi:hypothetical protein
MKVSVVQAGKEKDQGVGYLPDGTMIVVDGGDKLIGKNVDCEVTRIFQTVAGKMIFATPKGHRKTSQPTSKPRAARQNIQSKNFVKRNNPKSS